MRFALPSKGLSIVTVVAEATVTWCFGVVTAAAAPEIRTVALTGDQAPGTAPGVVFSNFNNVDPVINNAGQTAFYGILAGPGVSTDNDRGIWSEGAGTLTLVAR